MSARVSPWAPPSVKKRRLELELPRPEPIIFIWPASKADVRLTIFKQEFHVHSTILKLYSPYFRKFLDSPDKVPASAFAPFPYEYVSVVDEKDVSWVLDVATKVPSGNLAKFSVFEHPETEIEAFRKLLCAMYNRPYTIYDAEELQLMADLADYYCALPILSATLVGGLVASPMFDSKSNLGHFSKFAPDILLTAYRLRNPVLFRECFVHVVARWGSDTIPVEQKHLIAKNMDIFRLVNAENDSLNKRLQLVDHYLMIAVSERALDLKALYHYHADAYEQQQDNLCDLVRLGAERARLHKAIQAQIQERWGYPDEPGLHPNAPQSIHALYVKMEDIEKNNLLLDRTEFGPGIASQYKSFFLSASITDEEMPWDATQVDW